MFSDVFIQIVGWVELLWGRFGVKRVGDSVVLGGFVFGLGLFFAGYESFFVEFFQELGVVDCKDFNG